MYSDYEDRFVARIEESAEEYLAGFCDADEAYGAVKKLMHDDPKWERRIRLYMDIEMIPTLNGLRAKIREWYKNMESEKESVWDMYFPDREDDDGITDFMTDDD